MNEHKEARRRFKPEVVSQTFGHTHLHRLQKGLFGLGDSLFELSARLLHFSKQASLPGTALPLKPLLLFGADSSVSNGGQVGELKVADRRVYLTQRCRHLGSNLSLRNKTERSILGNFTVSNLSLRKPK